MRVILWMILFSAGGLYGQQSINSNKLSSFQTTYQSLKLYPNPVITTARLEFKLAERAQIQVSLLNILGAQIKNYLNEMRAPGVQIVPFQADQLERGTYFVRISINGEIIKTIRVAVAPQ
jgi:hypothetical protein